MSSAPAVWRRSAVLRFPTSSRSHTLTRRGLGLPFLPAAGRKLTLSAICILKKRALALLADTHTRTLADTYALLQHVPSHRHLQSVSVLPYLNTCSFPFHTPRMPFDACREPGARVSWHADERSCLMSQLSEDRPGTSAQESEIQPLR